MASMVLTMSSPHEKHDVQNSPIPFRPRKNRRAPKKAKKHKKPYFKLSWAEKEEINEQERLKGEARLANIVSAPNNTTQFLMQEHPTTTPNQTPVNMSYDKSDDSSASSDEEDESSGIFMENDFAETFKSIKAEVLETKSKPELMSLVVDLERTVTDLRSELEYNTSRAPDAGLLSEIEKLRAENARLVTENASLQSETNKIPITPIKNGFSSFSLQDTDNETRRPL